MPKKSGLLIVLSLLAMLLGVAFTQTTTPASAANTCYYPKLNPTVAEKSVNGKLTAYRLIDLPGQPTGSDPNTGLSKLLDPLSPTNGTSAGTFWSVTNNPRAVAIQVEYSSPRALDAFQVFTHDQTKSPFVYFQYSQDGVQWGDIWTYDTVNQYGNGSNVSLKYGSMKYFPFFNSEIQAKFFRLVFDNSTYLYDTGYISDLQFCTRASGNQDSIANRFGSERRLKPQSYSVKVTKSNNAVVTSNGNQLADGITWTSQVADAVPKEVQITENLPGLRFINGIQYFATFSAVAKHTKVEYKDKNGNWQVFNGNSNVSTGGYGPTPAYGTNLISLPLVGSSGGSLFGEGTYYVQASAIRMTITNPEKDWNVGGYGELDAIGWDRTSNQAVVTAL